VVTGAALSGGGAGSSGAAAGAATAAGAGGGTAGGLSAAAIGLIAAGGAGAAVATAVAVSGPSDNDKDGFDEETDCNDNNAAINPNAQPAFSNGRFENAQVVCPDGVTNFTYDVVVLVDGGNNSCTDLAVNSASLTMRVTRAVNTTNFVGQTFDFSNVPLSPSSVGQAGGSATIRLSQSVFCTNSRGASPGTLNEFTGEVTLATSAGRFTVPIGNTHLIQFPLRPAGTGGAGGLQGFAASAVEVVHPDQAAGRGLRWTAEIEGDDASLDLVLNEEFVALGRGRSAGRAMLRDGELKVQGVVTRTSGEAGLFRFELDDGGSFEPGSLRVESGEVIGMTDRAILFRIAGRAGERISFAFRVKD
jgi:hypothetical protein